MSDEPLSLRTYLEQLRQLPPTEFVRVEKEISPVHEACALMDALEKQNRRPAFLFANVRGSALPVVSNIFASRRRMALALGVAENQFSATLFAREAQRIPPEIVAASAAPVKQVIWRDDEIDLRRFPAFTHHADDAGAYITGGLMAIRDPETGVRNVGVYRHWISSARTLGIHLSESSHANLIYAKYCARRQAMPVAITIGYHPAFYLGVLSFVGLEVDEVEVAGALMQRPVPLVPCETVDLQVPAHAEIVLEGFIAPDERAAEGPIGEYSGTYGYQDAAPVIRIHTITMRRDPIWLDIFAGHPDHQLLGGTPRLASTYRAVRVACPLVREIYMPTAGVGRYICYIAIKKRFEGEAKNVACAAFGADPFIKYVVVVDEDVNIFDDSEVLQAIALRSRADSFFMIERAKGHSTDPVALDEYLTHKIGIDATRPLKGYPKEIAVPGAETINVKDYLPEF